MDYFLSLSTTSNTGDKLDDYAKARYKSNGALTIMKLTTPGGGMNPDMSLVDFVQDGDLNKSLKHFVSIHRSCHCNCSGYVRL